jgi:nucleoside-diphosphate-sugar epimerase
VLGTLNLLELCQAFGVSKFVLASSSSLYGAHNPRSFREDANTDRPLSPYAASKKAAGALCYTCHHLHDLDVKVLRYFTVCGQAGCRPGSYSEDEVRPLRVFRHGW